MEWWTTNIFLVSRSQQRGIKLEFYSLSHFKDQFFPPPLNENNPDIPGSYFSSRRGKKNINKLIFFNTIFLKPKCSEICAAHSVEKWYLYLRSGTANPLTKEERGQGAKNRQIWRNLDVVLHTWLENWRKLRVNTMWFID